MASRVEERIESAVREKMADATKIVRYLCLGGLALVNLALVATQLAIFPVYSDTPPIEFHCLFYFAPFAATALYLSLSEFMAMALGLGLALCLHANCMPVDYYEVMFASPLLAVCFSVVGALTIWGVLHAVMRRFERHTHDLAHPSRARGIAIAASLLVASLLVTVFTTVAISVAAYGPGISAQISIVDVFLFRLSATYLSSLLQILIDWLTMVTFALPADVLFQKRLANHLSRTIRSVFRRWLFIVVIAAFLVTTAIAYCIETASALKSVDIMLGSQLEYLITQIEDYISRQAVLKEGEDNLVLSKARSAARLLELDPAILASQERVEQLRDSIDVASLTICDENGTVVADSDGRGIGVFNFGDSSATLSYLNLIRGTVGFIIEEPRNSVDETGADTDEVRVFAGVPRLDANGFVQVSIGAKQYQEALEAASIDNLADKFTFGNEGIACIARNGKIITAGVPGLEGKHLSSLFGAEWMDEEEWDIEREYLVSGDLQSMQVGEGMNLVFFEGDSYGVYDVFVMSSVDSVFASRTSAMLLSSLFYLVLYAVVFVLASILLDKVVMRGFVRTNNVLELITNGDLDQRLDEHGTEEFELLSDGINAMVGALKDSIAEAESRYDQELATAKAIQESALPNTFPPFPEVDAFDIHASMNAAREVGGDFYDFFLIDDHTLGFLIADVSGKGIPAALFMMTAKTQIENYMLTGMELSDAIQSANHHLCKGNEAGMFVTVWAATLDWMSGELTYVNAGHNPPLLRHDGSWQWLTKKCGLFLGTFETAKYRTASLVLDEGDELFLYTDGVNEAFSIDEEEYGNARLEAFLAGHTVEHPRALIEAVKEDVAMWTKGAEQSDDITMLSLEYGMRPQARASLEVPATLDQLERVIGFVHEELGRRLCPFGVQNKLDIALEEMFVNVCNYAYAGDEKPGTVTVSYLYTANPSTMTIELDDTGVPFDPLTRRDPTMPDNVLDIPVGGLGIMMTRRCVDDFSYARLGDHNHVTFTKRW